MKIVLGMSVGCLNLVEDEVKGMRMYVRVL